MCDFPPHHEQDQIHSSSSAQDNIIISTVTLSGGKRGEKHVCYISIEGVCGGAFVWGTVLQAGRSHSIPCGVMVLLHWLNPSGHIVVLGSTLRKWVPAVSPRIEDGQCVGLTTLPPSCADCLDVLGASTSWSRKGLSRPVTGLLYLNLCVAFYYKSLSTV